MSLLVTGFGPFRDIVDNPSSALARELCAEAVVLPVRYPTVERFAKDLAKNPPSAVLCLGLNAKAKDLRFEVYAHNRIGGETGSSGRKHTRTKVIPSGPETLGQTFLSPSQIKDCPIEFSYTPGDYLCNFLLYSLLWRLPSSRVGFIHIPLFETVSQAEQLAQLKAFLDQFGS